MKWWTWLSRQRSGAGHNLAAGRDASLTVQNFVAPPQIIQGSPAPDGMSDFRETIRRFFQVHAWHGVTQAEIPEFMRQMGGPAVTMRDIATDSNFAEILDEELLDFTTDLFALDVDYLRRPESDRVFRAQHFYGHPERLLRFMLVDSVVREDDDGVPLTLWATQKLGLGDQAGTLYLLATALPDPDPDDGSDPDPERSDVYVGGVFTVEIARFRGRSVYRYFPVEALPWGHYKCRYDWLSVIWMSSLCGVDTHGRLVHDRGDLLSITDGRRFPSELHYAGAGAFDHAHFDHWSVYDLPRVNKRKTWISSERERYEEYIEWAQDYSTAVEKAIALRNSLVARTGPSEP